MKLKCIRDIRSRDKHGEVKYVPEIHFIDEGKSYHIRADTNPSYAAPRLFKLCQYLARRVEKLEDENQFYKERVEQLEIQNAAQARKIEEQNEIITTLFSRLEKIEKILKLDSTNSSKPPSTDGFKKKKKPVKNSRVKSGKKPGGQKGRKGTTLEMVDHPDKVIRHELNCCPDCNCDLSDVPVIELTRRQVFDIPPIVPIISEHQSEVKSCPFVQNDIKPPFLRG